MTPSYLRLFPRSWNRRFMADGASIAIATLAAGGILLMAAVPPSAEVELPPDRFEVEAALAQVTPIQPLHGLMIDLEGNILVRPETEAVITNLGATDIDHPNAVPQRLSERCRRSYDYATFRNSYPGWTLICLTDRALLREMGAQ